MHKRNPATTSQGERAHLLPMISFTWNDDWNLLFVILGSTLPHQQQNKPPPSTMAYKRRSACMNPSRQQGTEVSKLTSSPTTDLSHTQSRCHVAVGNVATKQRTMTGFRHSSLLCSLGLHSQSPIPHSSQPTSLKHRTTHDHHSTTPSHHCTFQWWQQCHVTGPSVHTTTPAPMNNKQHGPQTMTERNTTRNERPPRQWCPTHGQRCQCRTTTMNDEGQRWQRWPPVDEWQMRPPPTSGNECLPLCMSPLPVCPPSLSVSPLSPSPLPVLLSSPVCPPAFLPSLSFPPLSLPLFVSSPLCHSLCPPLCTPFL